MAAPLTWTYDWNQIIRALFMDPVLHQLMMIPLGTSIIDFVDRYFMQAGYTSKTLKDEDVRIVYSFLNPKDTDVLNIVKMELHFDVYVRNEHLHDVGRDRLMTRTMMITLRLIQFFTKLKRYVLDGYRFWCIGDTDLGTPVIGYARHCVMFRFMRVYN